MPLNQENPYYHQVALLVAILPLVEEEDCFALKGGTAINLFFQDMPRLSVDIDLTYLPVEDRKTSLIAISHALKRITARVEKVLKGTRIEAIKDAQGNILKLMIVRKGARVKVEVSPVLRGSLLAASSIDISASVEEKFSYSSMQVLNRNEVYAGKLCAALDRQHPRDLFDVKLLFEGEGLTEELMNIFMIYLISGNRPIAEMLAPRISPLSLAYNEQFVGMEFKETTLEELEETRLKLIEEINHKMTNKQKQFLLSFKSLQPDWHLLKMGDVSHLPAIQWKVLNLEKMSNKKRAEAITKLERVLSGEKEV